GDTLVVKLAWLRAFESIGAIHHNLARLGRAEQIRDALHNDAVAARNRRLHSVGWNRIRTETPGCNEEDDAEDECALAASKSKSKRRARGMPLRLDGIGSSYCLVVQRKYEMTPKYDYATGETLCRVLSVALDEVDCA